MAWVFSSRIEKVSLAVMFVCLVMVGSVLTLFVVYSVPYLYSPLKARNDDRVIAELNRVAVYWIFLQSFRWSHQVIGVMLDPDAPQCLLPILNASMTDWNVAFDYFAAKYAKTVPLRLKFSDSSVLFSIHVIYQGVPNAKNIGGVTAMAPSSSVITIIVNADVFNTTCNKGNSLFDSYLRLTMMHELGHALGLDHTAQMDLMSQTAAMLFPRVSTLDLYALWYAYENVTATVAILPSSIPFVLMPPENTTI